MHEYYNLIDDNQDIRQGDVILSKSLDGESKLGFILTADCDIAQKKSRNKFTVLEVVPAKYFVEFIWASDQIRRLFDKQSIVVKNSLNAEIKRSHLNFTELTLESLNEWLAQDSVENILNIITKNKVDTKLLNSMIALQIAIEGQSYTSPLAQLVAMWSQLGKDKAWQKNQIKESLDYNKGFSDFFLVPELPGLNGLGFVILLRSIFSLHYDDVFKTELDAKINGHSNAYHRSCRLSEGIRHSVTQKLAFLFSRIGMTVEFENACDVVSELVAEDL